MLNATPAGTTKTVHARGPAPATEPRAAPIDRALHGLLATGLSEDIRTRAAHTVIAPTNAAFDELPWAFEDLVRDPDLVDVRFDLFEGLVLRGDVDDGDGVSLGGEVLRVGGGCVAGPHGTARILRSFVTGNLRVHVVDRCALGIDPHSYVDAEYEVCDAQLC